MQNLSTPLSEEELDLLDNFLLSRLEEHANNDDQDEGIFDLSTLDGYFTAIVSGPKMIPPSRWLPGVWGDFEPQWENEAAFEGLLTLLLRHMNSIASHLMNEPDTFEPLFMEHEIDGKTYSVVDEWCYGYMRGVDMDVEEWSIDDPVMQILLTPINIFGTEGGWEKLKAFNENETENIRSAITPNIREIYGYWLTYREQDMPAHLPVKRNEPRIGRNDPCPCGSGKKYKKCCLH